MSSANSTTYDVIIVGAGQAGPSLADRCNREGLRTALIERKNVGGTCVNVGCIPTKTLIGSARIAHFAREAGRFGIDIAGDIRVDMKRVKARKDEIASNQGMIDWLENMEHVDLVRGHARFTASDTLEVEDRRLQAGKVFLDVGARARVPQWPGLDGVDYLTNSGILDLEELPEHLVIIGGSYIGLEFAQMYRRFGSRVTVIEMRDRLISREDRDVSLAAQEILEGEGVEFRLGAECISVEPAQGGSHAGGRIRVQLDCDDDEKSVTGTHLLLAVGRTPNTDDLGLGHAGIETDDQGHIKVDDQLRTNVPGIWALGEVNGRGAFTHTSYNDFEIVAANLFDGDPRRATDRIPCYALYIDPPLGRVGMTENEARETGRSILIGKREMSKVGRAKEFGDTRGFMKMLVDTETKHLLGAAILGMSGDEVVHSLLDVMYAEAPYTTISRAVHIHPTVSELVPTTLQSLQPLGEG